MPGGTSGGAMLIEWLPAARFVGGGSVAGMLQFGPVNAAVLQSHVYARSFGTLSTHTPSYIQPIRLGPYVELEQSPGPAVV